MFDRLNDFLSRYSHKWYFLPLVGGLLFLIVNLILFLFLSISNRADNSSNDPSPTPQSSPQSTVEPTSEPVIENEIELEPSPSPKTASPSPKASVSPTPKTSPSPSPVVYDKQDIQIKNPEHQKNYENTNIEIEMKVLANSEVEKLEVVINGSVKESFSSDSMKKSYDLSAGKYTLKGRAKLKNGETIESGELKFGTGGVAWNQPDPSPSPLDIVNP